MHAHVGMMLALHGVESDTGGETVKGALGTAETGARSVTFGAVKDSLGISSTD